MNHRLRLDMTSGVCEMSGQLLICTWTNT